MRRCDVERLDATRPYWVLSVVAPCRDWTAAPGCRGGARFLVDTETLLARRDRFATFDTQLDCLEWMMEHRGALSRSFPGAAVRPVLLDRWLLGLG